MSARWILLFPAVLLCDLSLQAMPPSCRPLNSFEQGSDLRQSQMVPGYNATARVDVRGSWDVYTTASYIFWQPREENLAPGIYNGRDTTAYLAIDGKVINMNYHFKSGYKVGLGILTGYDNWDAYVEYTWLSGHQRVSATAPENGRIIPFQGHVDAVQYSVFLSTKSKWKCELNIVDVQLARSYYVGTKLVFRPFFGGRAAWINQKYSTHYILEILETPFSVRNSSHSWGLGPEVGFSANWLLGYGFRAIGSAEADILFTRYNLHSVETFATNPMLLDVDLYQRHAFFLRPHSNLEFGFGWETYFDNHNYHFDILGSYCFQIFWDQNMFSSGDLYIHGVTGQLRLDF